MLLEKSYFSYLLSKTSSFLNDVISLFIMSLRHYKHTPLWLQLDIKKRFNKWYVYELHQYWDKELKKPRQRTKYLGVAEHKDGPYSKASLQKDSIHIQQAENAILDWGNTYAIDQVSQSIGLSELIQNSFADLDSIMALICFQIIEGTAMYNC